MILAFLMLIYVVSRLDRSCIFVPRELDPDSAWSIGGRFSLRLARVSSIKDIRVRLIGLLQV